LGLGIVLGVFGYVMFYVADGGVDPPRSYDLPATVVIQCGVGNYAVFQATSDVNAVVGTLSNVTRPTLTSDDVRVSGPGGRSVTTWQSNGSQSMPLDGVEYSDVVGFHAAVAGRYVVKIAYVVPSTVIVGPTLGTLFAHAAPWLLFCGAGFLVGFVGAVILLVAAIRKRWSTPAPATDWSAPLPPGYTGVHRGRLRSGADVTGHASAPRGARPGTALTGRLSLRRTPRWDGARLRPVPVGEPGGAGAITGGRREFSRRGATCCGPYGRTARRTRSSSGWSIPRRTRCPDPR